jgi:hypothetical protein
MLDTARLEALVKTLNAHRTFPRGFCERINLNSPERARMNTVTASYTEGVVDHDNPVFSFCYGFGGTHEGAIRIHTLHAGGKDKISDQFPLHRSRFDRDDKIPPGPEGQIVLLLTGDLARMATNASVDIDKQYSRFHLTDLSYLAKLTT